MSSPFVSLSSPSSRKSALATQLFATLDLDGDGWIDATDLGGFIEDATKLNEILLTLDPSHSGRVSLERFVESFDLFVGDDELEGLEQEEDDSQEGRSPKPNTHTNGDTMPTVEEDTVGELHRTSEHRPSPVASTGDSSSSHSSSSSSNSSSSHHHKSVSFDPTVESRPPSIKITAPRRGSVQPTQANLKPPLSSKKLLLKKGYASLKHSLILDDLRRSPAAIGFMPSVPSSSPSLTPVGGSGFPASAANVRSAVSPFALPPATTGAAAAATASVLSPSSTTSSSATATSMIESPIKSPPPAFAGRHHRQASSTDYSFTYSKSHSSLVERARKILNWCEGADGSNGDEAESPTNATISFPEIETSIHYLARSFTESEQSTVLELFHQHHVTALPVPIFRDIIKTCLEREEAQKAALLAASKSSSSTATSPPSGSSSSGSISIPHHIASREFQPDAFVASFIEVLRRKVESMGTMTNSESDPISSSYNLLTPSANPNSSSPPLSEAEAFILQLRTQLRQSESERIHQKQRYDFNLIFTKKIEADNWSLRDTIARLESEQKHLLESLDESRSGLETHRQLVHNLEANLAHASKQATNAHEEYENLRVMLELERKRGTKLQYEIEKLQSSLTNAANLRTESNRIYFREGLEEMRKVLGNVRYQRQLQLQVAQFELVQQEKSELIDRLKEANITIAQQQRILNELQGDQLGKLQQRSSIIGLGSELRPDPAASASSTATASGVDGGASLSDDLAHLVSPSPSPPVAHGICESLSDELADPQVANASADMAATVAELQARVTSLTGELRDSEQMCRNARDKIHHLDALLVELRTSNADLTTTATTLERQHTEEFDRMQSELASQHQQLTLEHDAALTEMRQAHQAELEALRATHATELQKRQNEERKRASEQLEQQTTFLRQKHADAVKEMQVQHAAELAKSQQKYDNAANEIAALKTTLSSEMSKLAQQHADELSRLSHAKQVGDAKYQSSLSALESTIASLQSALSESEASRASHICTIPSSTNEQIVATQKAFTEEQNRRIETETKVKELQQQLKATQAEAASKQTEYATLLTAAQHQSTKSEQAQVELRHECQQQQGRIRELESIQVQLEQQSTTVQSQLRSSRDHCNELTLQLSTSLDRLAAAERDHDARIDELNQLVERWRSEAEKARTANETARQEREQLQERLKELERKCRQLEEQIASHVCASNTGANTASPLTLRSPTPSPPPVRSPSIDLTASTQRVSFGSPTFISTTPTTNLISPPSSIIAQSQAKPSLPYSNEQLLEVHAYATFLTESLGSDTDLKHLFPFDLLPADQLNFSPANHENFAGFGLDLLRKLKDGLLLAKLINFVAPHTIDERVLNKRTDGGSLGWKAIVENLNVCITSAKSLGLTMRVPSDQDEAAELDYRSGAVVLADGRRVSIGDESDSSASASTGGSSTNTPTDSPTEEVNYVGIELGSSQLLLMSVDSSIEQVDVVLDFLFQLLKTRLVHALFGPERRKIERLHSILTMPKVDANVKKALIDRTPSIQVAPVLTSPPQPSSALSSKSTSKSKAKSTMSKFATLSRALPSNLSSTDHKRFVTNFTNTILCDFDATNELSVMTPEQLLLRWINFQILTQVTLEPALANAGHLVAHMSDLDTTTYSLLIHRIDEWRFEKGVIADKSECFDIDSATSATILDYLASTLSVQHFHAPTVIQTKHHRLNLLLVALLFRKWPLMEETAPNASKQADVSVSSGVSSGSSPSDIGVSSRPSRLSFSLESGTVMSTILATGAVSVPSLDGLTDEERESSLLKSFLNSSGIPHIHINHLFTDIRSGLVLLRFLDFLQPQCVDWKTVELTPNNKFKCIGNLNLFLQLAKDHLHLAFVNVGAVDLYSDNNSKYVLAIMWQLLRYHTIQRLKDVRHRLGGDQDGHHQRNRTDEISDSYILDWANHKVATDLHPITQANHAAPVTSFQDITLKNSLFLLNLLDNIEPGCVDWQQVEIPPIEGPTDSGLLLRNASLTISIARKLGAELFALPQDIVNSNKKVILLIVGSLMTIEGSDGDD